MNGWKSFGEALKGVFTGLGDLLPDNPLQGIRNALGFGGGNNNATPTARSNYNFGYNLPPTNTVSGQNYGADRGGGRSHAGQDFDIAGPDATFESQIGGKVMRILEEPGGGYGRYVDIYNKDMDVTERIAEGAEILVKVGDEIKPGTPVARGETGTGVIHYEIRKGKEETYGFTGTLDPMEFLKSHTVHTPRTGRPANAPIDTNITPNQVIEVPDDAGFSLETFKNFSSSSNPNAAASLLNGQSGMFSMGSQFMMAPTIINNYNTVAGGSGSGNDDSFSTGFPSFAQGFIVPYSMDALK